MPAAVIVILLQVAGVAQVPPAWLGTWILNVEKSVSEKR